MATVPIRGADLKRPSKPAHAGALALARPGPSLPQDRWPRRVPTAGRRVLRGRRRPWRCSGAGGCVMRALGRIAPDATGAAGPSFAAPCVLALGAWFARAAAGDSVTYW